MTHTFKAGDRIKWEGRVLEVVYGPLTRSLGG